MRQIDLKGQVFGNWLVIGKGRKRTYIFKGKKVRLQTWKVVCEHTTKEVFGHSLRSGTSKGCPRCCGERQSKERKGKRFRSEGITSASNTYFTHEAKLKQYQKQKGICGLCGKELPVNLEKCHWDHNHETGKPRSILHSKCNNQIIAMVEKHPELIEKAKAYLQEWK
jgi:hypothetical protein